MFIAVLVTIAKRQQRLDCSLTDTWISKVWWIHTMKYYLAFKRKKILTYALAWTNLEDTMLNETSSITEGQITA